VTRFFVHVVVIATLTLPLKATAQQNPHGGASAKPVRLSDAGFQRLYGRLMGEWQLNNRSPHNSPTLAARKYIYSPWMGAAFGITSALGVSSSTTMASITEGGTFGSHRDGCANTCR